MQKLCQLILSNKQWLFNRIIEYTIEQSYSKYEPISEECFQKWFQSMIDFFVEVVKNINIHTGLASIFNIILSINKIPGICNEDIALDQLLIRHKYCRNSFLDLILQSDFSQEEAEKYHCMVESFFDSIEIKYAKYYQDKIYYQTCHDSLTGLPNRKLLNERMNDAIDNAQKKECMIALLFIDLDDFKSINDVLGHDIGDGILSGIAQRIKGIISQPDTVSRWGGDEFIILLSEVPTTEDALKFSKKILNAFEAPFEYKGYRLYVTASIGIAFYPQHGEDTNTVLKNADMAMYSAKEKGRNTFQIYTSDINKKSFEKLMLTNDLRHALERDEFVLYYQPQVNIYTGKVVGMEALIRWQHPELGLVSPASFIPLAEDMGLIVPIGEWVLYTACTQNKVWQDSGLSPLRVAVNLSAHQLQQSGFVERVMSVLEETGLEPNYLDLEITESVALQNIELTIEKLNALQERGVHISMDDFGTGYSSLSYLMRLPINTLKIDRSFVKEINTNTKKVAIADAIVSMAHSLKFKVIAEGVENHEQLHCVRTRKCDEIQGYLFSKPLTTEAFEKILRQDKRL